MGDGGSRILARNCELGVRGKTATSTGPGSSQDAEVDAYLRARKVKSALETALIPRMAALQCRCALLRARLPPSFGHQLPLCMQRGVSTAGPVPGPKYPGRDLVAGHPGCRGASN